MFNAHDRGRRRLAFVGAATAAVLGISACSSSSGTKTAAGSVSKITVEASGAYITYAPLFLAKAKGYFTAQKLDAEINLLSNSSTAMSALLKNSAQFALVAAVQDWQSDASGRKVTIIGSNDGQNTLSLVVSTAKYTKIGITPAMPIKQRITRLKGLSFGVRGLKSQDGATLQSMLNYAGLTAKDVKLVTLTNASALVSSLAHGVIDGFVGGAPFPQQAVSTGAGKLVSDLSTGEFPPFAGASTTVYSAAPSYLKSHSSEAQRFVNAIAMAQRYISLHPADAAKTLHSTSDFAAYPMALLVSTLTSYAKSGALPASPVSSTAAFQKAKPLLDAALGKPSTIDFSTTYTNEFATKAAATATAGVK